MGRKRRRRRRRKADLDWEVLLLLKRRRKKRRLIVDMCMCRSGYVFALSPAVKGVWGWECVRA